MKQKHTWLDDQIVYRVEHSTRRHQHFSLYEGPYNNAKGETIRWSMPHDFERQPTPMDESVAAGFKPWELYSNTRMHFAFSSLKSIYDWFYTREVVQTLVDREFCIRRYKATALHFDRQSMIDAEKPFKIQRRYALNPQRVQYEVPPVRIDS